jgi:hypothetical protein
MPRARPKDLSADQKQTYLGNKDWSRCPDCNGDAQRRPSNGGNPTVWRMFCIEGPCEATWLLHWGVVGITMRSFGKSKGKRREHP